jgi:tripartite-type tricarboxylate transporter receptor subunit TctC
VAFSARGFGYQKGVDQAIVDRMIEALEICFEDEGFQANMATTGSELHFVTGDDYYNLLVGQLDRRLEIWGVEK